MRLYAKVMAVTSLVLMIIFVLFALLLITTESVFLRQQAETRAQLTLEALTSVARQAFFADQYQELRDHLVMLERQDRDLAEAVVVDRLGAAVFGTGQEASAAAAPPSECMELERTFFVDKMYAGKVRIRYCMGRLESTRRRVALVVLAGLVAALLFAGLSVHLAVKYLVSAPLDEFAAAAERISAGELGGRTGLEGRGDEIGKLARGFAAMTDRLRSAREEVAAVNRGLEQRVVERTRELRDEQARSASILDSLADALVTVDREHRVTYWSCAAATLTGRSAASALGRPFAEVLPLEEWSGPGGLDRFLETASGPALAEAALRRSDGRSLPVTVSVAPLRGQGGPPVGAVLAVRDQTSLAELREQVRRSDRLSALGVLAAGVAHELNNPLGNVSTYVQLLGERLAGGGSLSPEWLPRIESEIERASAIVRQLLTFARQEPAAFRNVELQEPLAVALDLAASHLSACRATVRLEVPPEPAVVLGDPRQLQQVFINLVTNAAQAMEGAGGGEVLVTVAAASGAWLVEVADRGPGIPAEHRERIFTPFFTTKDVGRGTGLGLSVSYGIIQDHRGSIGFRSRPGGGTVFRVELPAASIEAPEVDPA